MNDDNNDITVQDVKKAYRALALTQYVPLES